MGRSAARSGAFAEQLGDLGYVVERPGRNRDHEVVRLVVAECEPRAVDPEKRDRCGERESFVAVQEGVVACELVQQGGCLRVDVRIGVLAERGRLRARER